MNYFIKSRSNISFLLLVLLFGTLAFFPSIVLADESEIAAPVDETVYVDDQAGLVSEPHRLQIAENCRDIEEKMRIRVRIRTEQVKDLTTSATKVEAYFSEWIRNIGLEKKGILIYALLPEGSAHGKVHLRVGIGLKYLITREMGEKILNEIILPSNATNNDGRGFLEGVLAIRRMLVDELQRDRQIRQEQSGTFSLRGFLWTSKEILLALLVALFLCYIVFFVERCPRCNGTLSSSAEILKKPGVNTLGLRRRTYACDQCGFSRRKKEPLYPSGKAGIIMRLSGTRRNVKID